MGNEWLRKPGPNARDKVKMASPAGTHAFLRHALWPHESMTVQKTWQRGLGRGQAAGHSRFSMTKLLSLLSTVSLAPLSPTPRLHACLLASFLLPSFPFTLF